MKHTAEDIEKLWEILKCVKKKKNNPRGLEEGNFNQSLADFKNEYLTCLKRDNPHWNHTYRGSVETNVDKAIKILSEAKKIEFFHPSCAAQKDDEILCVHYKLSWLNYHALAIPGIKIMYK